MLYFCTSGAIAQRTQKFNIMKTKDKQDEAQRHAQRNYVIKEVRNQLVTYQGCTFTEADILIGRIWGVGDRKIREIVSAEPFSAVSADDLTKLAVSLRKISKIWKS
jgi:predicted DNA-binding helix-hairpin-helix protein